MSVTRVCVKPNSATDKASLSGERNRAVTFLVVTDNAGDNEITVGEALIEAGYGVLTGAFYVDDQISDVSVVCESVSSQKILTHPSGAGNVWEVACTYTNHPGKKPDEKNDPTNPNPFLRPPEIVWGEEPHQVILDKAIALTFVASGVPPPVSGTPSGDPNNVGNYVPVLNSANDSFGHLTTCTDAYQTFRYTINLPSFPRAQSKQYRYVANSDESFKGFFSGDGINEWLCKPITGQWVYEQIPSGTQLPGGVTTQASSIGYWRVTYSFVWNDKGWDFWIPDKGSWSWERKLDANNSWVSGIYVQTAPTDARGLPVKVIYLNGQGNRLDDGIAKANGPVLLGYRRKTQQSFSSLGIGL
jgi:hypothetical protein